MIDTNNPEEVQGGLTNVTSGKSGALSLAGKIALDPTQTAEILKNMQLMINERTGPLNQLQRGLERASAWATPNTEGLKTQALAKVNEQQNTEDKSLFDMRTQMAAYKAAQAQAERFKQRAGEQIGGGAPAAPGAAPSKINPEAQMPAQIRQALQNALAQNDQVGYDKIYNAWAQKQAEVYANPNMDEPKIPVTENVNGQWVRKVVSTRDYRENPNKYRDTPETQAAVQSVMAPAATSGDALPKLKQAVFGTESSSGRADTTKPGIQGAIGPMQVTDDTFQTFKNRGIIPKEFDINNPEQNKAAGEKILDYYYKQYNGDVDKTLAAYHGGEGAINKDGSINLDRRDKLGTSIGEYIDRNKKAMGVAPVQTAAAAPTAGPRPTPEQLEQASAVQQAGNLKAAEETGKEVGKLAAEVTSAGRSAPEREIRSRDIVDLATDPELNKYIGMFAKKGAVPFVVKQVESGINAGQFGVVGIADLRKNLTQSKAPVEVIEKLDRLEKNLNAVQLEYAQTYLKGQGAVSDAERRLIASVVGNYVNNPAKFIELQGKVMQERAQFDARVNDAWGRYKDQYGTYADFDKFLRTDAKSLVDKHKKDLGTITGADTSGLNNPFQVGARPETGGTPSGKSDISSFHIKKT
jgi:soluble lytic murein transglycosylase-like protein